MPAPGTRPLGLELARTARAIGRAFDDALAAADGTASTWQILIALKSRQMANQRELADAVGIQDATLTHHLNGMESSGLLTRRRDPDNRRIHIVELTRDGEALFRRLRAAAVGFDQRLRAGIAAEDLAAFERVLARLLANVSD
ncbi:MAG TPA: MarR family transcriptional regulator [Kofleriaceae bacterium]|nr:MarR family transcriptional regulator [Kofleriaceae bacterium]